jgi:hypothetical protein
MSLSERLMTGAVVVVPSALALAWWVMTLADCAGGEAMWGGDLVRAVKYTFLSIALGAGAYGILLLLRWNHRRKRPLPKYYPGPT